MMLILLFSIFLVLLFMGMPVAYAMSISACITLFFDPSLPGIIIPQKRSIRRRSLTASFR